MSFKKIVTLLDTTSDDKDLPRFVTKNDAYIVVNGTITVTEPDNGKRNKSVAFKNNAPFIIAFQKSVAYKLTMQKI